MFLLLIFLLFCTFLLYHFYWKRRHLPPGPVPVPFLGNVLGLTGGHPRYDSFLEWQKQYGNVFTFWMSELPMVMVCDYKTIQDAFVKNYPEELSAKYSRNEVNKMVRGGTFGIMMTSGDLWREQRRFSLQVLRNFGLGKNLMEQKILNEVEAMLRYIKADEDKGGSCDIIRRIDVCVGSIINSVIFGFRFQGESVKDFVKIKTLLNELFRHLTSPGNLLVATFYWMRHVPPFNRAADKTARIMGSIFEFMDTQIAKHEEELDEDDLDSESADFCEEYLKEMYRQELKHGTRPEDNHFSKDQLRNICIDVWAAGLETTSNTCQFAVIYLLNHPDVYTKVKVEMDECLEDSKKLVTLEDKARLPYFQAFIAEVQRMANITVINFFHQTTADIVIDGYQIKKDTVVVPQIANVLFDEKIFPDPFTFNPDRFLDDSGRLKKTDEMIAFSVGKRQCMGESLARMEMFLILANLIRHFELLPFKGTPPSMAKKMGATVQPTPFKIRIKSLD